MWGNGSGQRGDLEGAHTWGVCEHKEKSSLVWPEAEQPRTQPCPSSRSPWLSNRLGWRLKNQPALCHPAPLPCWRVPCGPLFAFASPLPSWALSRSLTPLAGSLPWSFIDHSTVAGTGLCAGNAAVTRQTRILEHLFSEGAAAVIKEKETAHKIPGAVRLSDGGVEGEGISEGPSQDRPSGLRPEG